jgi:hypothetical protein
MTLLAEMAPSRATEQVLFVAMSFALALATASALAQQARRKPRRLPTAPA